MSLSLQHFAGVEEKTVLELQNNVYDSSHSVGKGVSAPKDLLIGVCAFSEAWDKIVAHSRLANCASDRINSLLFNLSFVSYTR